MVQTRLFSDLYFNNHSFRASSIRDATQRSADFFPRESNRSLTEIHNHGYHDSHIDRIVKERKGELKPWCQHEEEDARRVFFSTPLFFSSFPTVYLGFGGMQEISGYVHVYARISRWGCRLFGQKVILTTVPRCCIRSDDCVIYVSLFLTSAMNFIKFFCIQIYYKNISHIKTERFIKF